MMLGAFIISLGLIFLPAATQAASYEDLMKQTENNLRAYLPSSAPSPAPITLPSPTIVSTATAPTLHSIPQPRHALAHPNNLFSAPDEKSTTALLSNERLQPHFLGIQKINNHLQVSYIFDHTHPSTNRNPSGKKFRPFTSEEQRAIRQILEQEVAQHIPVRFVQVQDAKQAYLRISSAELSPYQNRTSRELGYATLPNPVEAQLVINSNICRVSEPDCPLFKSTVRHEIGHVLGLRHPEETAGSWKHLPTVMHAMSGKHQNYTPHDIASLQKAYGTLQTGLPTQLSEPTPNAITPYAQTAASQSSVMLTLEALIRKVLQ